MADLKIAKELSKLPTIRIGDIQELQGNLKDLSETNYKKLLKRLQTKGFLYPLYLWFDSKKIAYTLDGKQRHRVIEKEYGADTMLPYIEVKAKTRIDAKKEILAISSDYGTVTKEGYDEFSADFEIEDFEEVNTETTFDIWKDKDLKNIDADSEIFNTEDFEVKQLAINVSKHWFETIHRDIRKKIKEDVVSDDILELLTYVKMYYNYCKSSKRRFSVVVPLREDYAKIFQKYPDEIVSDFQNYIYEKYNKQSEQK